MRPAKSGGVSFLSGLVAGYRPDHKARVVSICRDFPNPNNPLPITPSCPAGALCEGGSPLAKADRKVRSFQTFSELRPEFPGVDGEWQNNYPKGTTQIESNNTYEHSNPNLNRGAARKRAHEPDSTFDLRLDPYHTRTRLVCVFANSSSGCSGTSRRLSR